MLSKKVKSQKNKYLQNKKKFANKTEVETISISKVKSQKPNRIEKAKISPYDAQTELKKLKGVVAAVINENWTGKDFVVGYRAAYRLVLHHDHNLVKDVYLEALAKIKNGDQIDQNKFYQLRDIVKVE